MIVTGRPVPEVRGAEAEVEEDELDEQRRPAEEPDVEVGDDPERHDSDILPSAARTPSTTPRAWAMTEMTMVMYSTPSTPGEVGFRS